MRYNDILKWLTLDKNPITNAKLKRQIEHDIEYLPESSILNWDRVREVYTSHWLNDEHTIDYQLNIGKIQITVQKINTLVYDVSIYQRPFGE
jgi:hypothetical protein